MNTASRFPLFNTEKIKTYPLSQRKNKVHAENLVFPCQAVKRPINLPDPTRSAIDALAAKIVYFRRLNRPVLLFTGAHLIKNGMAPLVADLVDQGMVTLVAGNGATTIHDFELALIGQTSEDVPNALECGQFGMAYEFAYINTALAMGHRRQWGYGESLAAAICDKEFQAELLQNAARPDSPQHFAHPEYSLLAACWRNNIPFTVHAGIGTDVIDQHASFDGAAKGACSARDFLIYAHHVSQLTQGGVALNIGSAVTGPEVLLKSVSMAANIGQAPSRLITADFDIRDHQPDHIRSDRNAGYYFRDQKSVLTRIPQAFGGQGFYIQGDQRDTFVAFYQAVIQALTDKE